MHLLKVNNYELEFDTKPWITAAKKLGPSQNRRNLLSTFFKQSKQNCYKQYFDSDRNNLKVTWKGIKSFRTLQNITTSVTRTISQGKNTITNPHEIANIFKNYFSSVAGTNRQSIKYSHKHFSDYLKYQCNNSIFIQSTESKEITTIHLLQNIKSFKK